MRRKVSIKLLALLLICCFINTSLNSSSNTMKVTNEPIIINIEYGNLGINFNLLGAFNSQSWSYGSLIYENLVTYDLNNPGHYKGVLATTWSVSSNGTIYTFFLRHNVKYHDGTNLNAYTMKYSIDQAILMNDPDSIYIDHYIYGASPFIDMTDINITQANSYLQAGGVKVIDDYTLQIKLSQPYFFFLGFLSFYPKAFSPKAMIDHMLSKYNTNQSDDLWGMVSLQTEFPNLHDWTKLGLKSTHNPAISGIVPQNDWYGMTYNDWPETHAVGTGPYRLVNYTTNEIDFAKNSEWWGTFAPNSADIISLKAEPDNDARRLHFLQGLTDIGYFPLDLSSNILDSYGNSITSGVVSYVKDQFNLYNGFFNMNDNLGPEYIKPANNIDTTWNESHIINDGITRYSNNNSIFASINNPFTALKFREALSYSLNYQLYMSDVFPFKNSAVRAEGTIPENMFGHQNDLISKNFIPSSQNLTLAKSLFQQVGWRGNITLLTNPGASARTEVVNILKNAIDSLNVGVNIIPESVNFTYYLVQADQHPLSLLGWLADFSDPYWMSYASLDTQGALSRSWNYSNPVIDKLFLGASAETDSNVLLNLYKQIEDQSASDYALLYLFDSNQILLTRSWLSNISESGALNALTYGIPFQFISKTLPNASSSNSTKSSSHANTPGFLVVPVASTVILYAFLKKRRIIK